MATNVMLKTGQFRPDLLVGPEGKEKAIEF
jgi:hypothetical protein